MKQNLRARLAVVSLLTLIPVLQSCGDEKASPAKDPKPTETSDAIEIEHPTGADDVVLKIDVSGGFVPLSYAFGTPPVLVLTGDGRVITAPKSQDEATRLTPLLVNEVDEAQIQEVLAAADAAGLLAAAPDYESDAPQVTDMPSTNVTITTDKAWAHSAYALSFESESGDRAALADFVDEATELLSGTTSAYAPEELRLHVEEQAPGTNVEADVKDWPRADIKLADIGDCMVVPAADVTETLEAATMTTFFKQDGVTYDVVAASLLPGDKGCDAAY